MHFTFFGIQRLGMAKKGEKNSVVEQCPIRNIVSRFGTKWSLLVIVTLDENGATRFGQLGKLIPDISSKMLASTLHVLEADGLVGRKVYPEVPIRVEYELTDMGQSLMPLIRSLTEWALAHQETILAYRRDFDGSK